MSARANVACEVSGLFNCLLGLFIRVLGLLKDLVAPSPPDPSDPSDPPQNGKTLFMDLLPLEMRLKIYKLCLHAPHKALMKGNLELQTRSRNFIFPRSGAFNLNILRVNKQVNKECDHILYEANTFYFIVAYTDAFDKLAHTHNGEYHLRKIYNLTTNINSITSQDVQLIRNINLEVRLPTYRNLAPRSHQYAPIQTALETFVSKFTATGHNLRNITIDFNHCHPPHPDGPLNVLLQEKSQNVLEPLGLLFGVRKNVRINGMTEDFADPLCRAMRAPTLS